MSTDDTGNGGAAKTFTQAEVDKIVRDRLAREKEKYGDYDELKAKAAEAEKSQSAIERIEAKLDEATKRADKAERESLIRDVADELGVSVKIARKFEGKTRDELLTDGRETLTEMGIEPDKTKRKSTKPETDEGGTSDTGGEGGSDHDDASSGSDNAAGESQNEPAPRDQRPSRRPVEALRSGRAASSAPNAADEMDPLKLIANVRRG